MQRERRRDPGCWRAPAPPMSPRPPIEPFAELAPPAGAPSGSRSPSRRPSRAPEARRTSRSRGRSTSSCGATEERRPRGAARRARRSPGRRRRDPARDRLLLRAGREPRLDRPRASACSAAPPPRRSRFGAGVWLERRGESTHAALAAVGAGLAGGYATLLAAAALYDLLPDWAALIAAAAIAGVARGDRARVGLGDRRRARADRRAARAGRGRVPGRDLAGRDRVRGPRARGDDRRRGRTSAGDGCSTSPALASLPQVAVLVWQADDGDRAAVLVLAAIVLAALPRRGSRLAGAAPARTRWSGARRRSSSTTSIYSALVAAQAARRRRAGRRPARRRRRRRGVRGGRRAAGAAPRAGADPRRGRARRDRDRAREPALRQQPHGACGRPTRRCSRTSPRGCATRGWRSALSRTSPGDAARAAHRRAARRAARPHERARLREPGRPSGAGRAVRARRRRRVRDRRLVLVARPAGAARAGGRAVGPRDRARRLPPRPAVDRRRRGRRGRRARALRGRARDRRPLPALRRRAPRCRPSSTRRWRSSACWALAALGLIAVGLRDRRADARVRARLDRGDARATCSATCVQQLDRGPARPGGARPSPPRCSRPSLLEQLTAGEELDALAALALVLSVALGVGGVWAVVSGTDASLTVQGSALLGLGARLRRRRGGGLRARRRARLQHAARPGGARAAAPSRPPSCVQRHLPRARLERRRGRPRRARADGRRRSRLVDRGRRLPRARARPQALAGGAADATSSRPAPIPRTGVPGLLFVIARRRRSLLARSSPRSWSAGATG